MKKFFLIIFLFFIMFIALSELFNEKIETVVVDYTNSDKWMKGFIYEL